MSRLLFPLLAAAVVLGLVWPVAAATPGSSKSGSRDSGKKDKGPQKKGANCPCEDEDAIQLTDAQRSKMVTATVGKTLVLRLPGDRALTGGATWELTRLTGDAVLVYNGGKPEYKAADERGPGRVGGAFIFKFKAAKPGRSKINAVFARPGQKDKPTNTYNVEVLVKKE